MGFLSDIFNFEKSHLKSLWKGIKDDPKRLVLGVDPLSTKMWNEILGRNDRALVSQLGGATSYDYQRALDEGINIGPGQTMHQIAGTIAGAYAGGALSGIGAAAPAVGTAAGTAGAAGAATAGGLSAVIPSAATLGAGLTGTGAAITAGVGVGAQEIGEEVPGVADPLELEEIRLTRPSLRVPGVPTLAKGGYASEAQARLMRARAHGWSPKNPRKKLPSRAVAEEFVEAKDRKYSGGFAENRYARGGSVTAKLEGQLRDITSRSPSAKETKREAKYKERFEAMSASQKMQLLGPQLEAAEVVMDEIGKTEFGTKYSLKDYTKMQSNLRQLREQYGRASQEQEGFYQGGLATMNMQEGGSMGWAGLEPLTLKQAAKRHGGGQYAAVKAYYKLKDSNWFYNEGEQKWYPPTPTFGAPDEGAAPTGGDEPPHYGAGPRGGRRGGRGGRRGGRGGRRGGGDGPGVGPPGPGAGPPPTDIPPYVAPPPRDPRAGRDTEYSAALRAHKARVAASLSVPPGGYAEGGSVNYYQEGGDVRPGHAEGPNPYPEGSARYKLWERKNHVDPAPPPVVAGPPPEPEDISWLDRLLRGEKGRQTRTERELEEMEEAHGGRVHYPRGYQYGGLAMAAPRGGVPPRVEPMPGYQFGGGVYGGAYRGIPGGMSRQFPARRGPIDGGGFRGRGRIPGRGGFPGGRMGIPRGEEPGGFLRPGGPGGFPGFGGGNPNIGRPGYDPIGDMGPITPGGGPGGIRPEKYGPVMQVPPTMPGGGGMPPSRIPGGGRLPPPGGGIPGGGGLAAMMRQAQGMRGRLPGGGGGVPGGYGRPGGVPGTIGGFGGYQGGGGGGGGGVPGGPRVPPNLRGYLQRQRMMNRPPANVGGGVNRVGQQDQQGGVARALQRGTGRRPMSRRGGFPGQNLR